MLIAIIYRKNVHNPLINMANFSFKFDINQSKVWRNNNNNSNSNKSNNNSIASCIIVKVWTAPLNTDCGRIRVNGTVKCGVVYRKLYCSSKHC